MTLLKEIRRRKVEDGDWLFLYDTEHGNRWVVVHLLADSPWITSLKRDKIPFQGITDETPGTIIEHYRYPVLKVQSDKITWELSSVCKPPLESPQAPSR
jgi:hypothetical protein